MHLGSLTGQSCRKAARQPAQGLVHEPRRSGDQWRSRGDVCTKATAAGVSRAPRLGYVAGLSLSRDAGADAPASDRHRSLQIRRVQAQRIYKGRKKSRLLEAGPALSRRHRIHDREEPLDRDPRLCRRQVRIDLRRHADDPVDPRFAAPAARCALRSAARQRQRQSDRQPRETALRQCRIAARDVACPRPAGLHRHHHRWEGLPRRGDAAAARRTVGHAAGDARKAAGIRA